MESVPFFYALQSASLFLLWIVLSLGMGADFHARGNLGVVATRGTVVPTGLLLALRNPTLYLFICHSTPVVLALTAARIKGSELLLRRTIMVLADGVFI